MLKKMKKEADRHLQRFGNLVTVRCESSHACPGATVPFDLLTDREYHRDHPDAPRCESGKVVTHSHFEAKAIISHTPQRKDTIYLLQGEFKVGDMLATLPADTALKDARFVDYNHETYAIQSVHEESYGDVRLFWVLHLSKTGGKP